MKQVPFSDINAYVNSKLGSGDICTGEVFSYLKIFQHALSYSLIGDKNKLIRNYFSLPYWVQVVLLFAKSIVAGRSSGAVIKSNLIIDNGRKFKVEGGEMKSYFFSAIIDLIGEENVSVINTGKGTDLQADIQFESIASKGKAIDHHVLLLLRDIRKVLRKAEMSGVFSNQEMSYLRSSFHIYFEQFQVYYQLMKKTNTKNCFFITHYHKEGLLGAAKILGIRTFELQHGLIATNDLYYIYPKQYSTIVSRALFPDRLLLFGVYWKKLLLEGCEWKESDLIITGNLQLSAIPELNLPHGVKENIVLIAAQKNSTEVYINYARSLQTIIQQHEGWKLVIRLHPLEKDVHRYQELTQIGIQVTMSDSPLIHWLRKARIQISIYSTTFYDALGHDVMNFSLQGLQYADYAQEMVQHRVAFPLQPHEDPIIKYSGLSEEKGQLLTRDDVYKTANPKSILEELQK